MKKENQNLFLQKNSPDGGFLQSDNWLKFQEKFGRRIIRIEDEKFVANIIEHTLPIVGKYFYCPRGPITANKIENEQKKALGKMLDTIAKENVGWLRFDPANYELLNAIKENIGQIVVKAPHDMQPKEIFVMDISKSHEQLLAEMKAKTRYNINLARKKGVTIKSSNQDEYVEVFLRLTKEMAERQGIIAHPEEYYRKMIKSFSDEMLKVYVAEYEGKIIAANLVLFFGQFATYLHGASSNENRNVMAPFLLQWQAIFDAKEKGCTSYDFGGVKTKINGNESGGDWSGITTFKLGFSPATKPIIFPGSYDIIINARKYAIYRGLQRAKSFAVMLKRKNKV